MSNVNLDVILDALNGDVSRAYEKKYEIIPGRLFRFEKFSDNRLKTLENNEIYMSEAADFNDIFDCLGIFWDTSSIQRYLEQYGIQKDEQFLNEYMDEMFKDALKPLKITCFSSELYNVPLWAHYAQSGTGFAIEYSFRELDVHSEFTQQLYPVVYESERFDMSKVLIRSFEAVHSSTFDSSLRLHFYKNLIKHSSWSYENEWRLMFLEKDALVQMPIKPTTIYITSKCAPRNEKRLYEIATKLGCQLIKLVPTRNDKKFWFDEVVVNY